MAQRYSDFVQIQKEFLPVFDILNDDSAQWQSFIPTQQFNDLLSRSITAITSSEASKRKSIWVRGTFGTGKSHASSVVKHLFCDDLGTINPYIENIDNVALKSQIHSIRKNKRYFSVTLKGVEKAYDIPRFTLSLQRETKKALAKVAPDFVVPSDYLTATKWIESHRNIFDTEVLAKDEELLNVFDTTEQILSRLEACDTSTYLDVERAISQHIGSVLDHSSISEWLVDVEKEIENRHIADGLIIFWDEFTSVMDTLKSDRINVLQNIAEKSQNHNVFLFLISHRVEAQSQDNKGKDITKMSDRFDEIEYFMDEISTYLIMRHSFSVNNEAEYRAVADKALPHVSDLMESLTDKNDFAKRYIERLFPMHPYTAFLCSTISNYVGSSNRSVIKFMHDENSGFEAFLTDEHSYNCEMMLTADSLWDFFYDEFDNDLQSTPFTNIYKSFEGKVKAQGDDYLRVFKVILLLNALSPKFKGDIAKLTPDSNVIGQMFVGDRVIKKLKDILDFLHDNKIVVRNVFDQFKITGSSYNTNEMNQMRVKVEAEFKTSYELLVHDVSVKQEVIDLFSMGSVRRETVIQFLPCEEPEHILRSKFNKFISDKPNYLHIAFFTSINEINRDDKDTILKSLSNEFENLIIVLCEETFSNDRYNKFIDTVATSRVARSHFNESEARECEKIAKGLVKKWLELLLNNTYTIYFNGKGINEGVVNQIPQLLNNFLGVKIFPKGFESVKITKDTFFGDKNCPTVIQRILEAQNRDQIIKHPGNAEPIKYIFEQNGNSLIAEDGSLLENAKLENSWLAEICRHMDECIDKAKKKYTDRFSLSEILASFIQPPFGMFTSFANCAAISYAIRKHKADLFLPGVSQPVSDERLCDYLSELFKMWKDGKSEANTKLLLRFGSPEESKLTGLFIDLFDLAKLAGVKISEIKSLDNVKWYIQEYCKQKVKQPLWVLKYIPEISIDLKDAVEKIVDLFAQENPSIDKIKSIYKILTYNKVDLNILLTTVDNYTSGFASFVKTVQDVRSEWWQEMLDAIDTLPSEIAFRKEADVKEKILKFIITKMEGGNNSGDNIGSIINSNNTDNKSINITGTPTPAESVANAKAKIKSINMPNMMWQKLALEMLDAHPELAMFFLNI